MYCKGKTTSAVVKAVAKDYVDDAVKKGKSLKDAQASARKVLSGGCSMSSSINGKKKPAITGGVKATKRTTKRK
jgi:hypothetical protein